MVKAYQREGAEKSFVGFGLDILYDKLVHLLAGGRGLIHEVLGGFAIAGVIVAAQQVQTGTMQVGDVVGFITALLMLVQPVRAIGTLNAVTQEGMAVIARIFQLLDRKNTITEQPSALALAVTKGHIRFEGVGFSYGQGAVLEISALR